MAPAGGGRSCHLPLTCCGEGRHRPRGRESRNLAQESHSVGGRRPLCNTNAKGGGVGGICQVRLSVSRGIKESGGIDGAKERERGGEVNAELQRTSLMTRANSARRLFVELVAARVDVRCSLSSSHGRFWAGEERQREEEKKMKKNACPTIHPSVPDSHASFHALAPERCTAPLQMTCVFSAPFFLPRT